MFLCVLTALICGGHVVNGATKSVKDTLLSEDTTSIVCPDSTYFRCRSDGLCIKPDLVCNTFFDCKDKSDEADCGECSVYKIKI